MTNTDFLKNNGFSDQGKTWVSRRTVNKNCNFWCYELGAHSNVKKEGTIEIDIKDVADENFDGSWVWKPDVREIISKITAPGFIGEIGATINVNAYYCDSKVVNNDFGFYRLLFFETDFGEHLVCKAKKDFEKGDFIKIIGVVYKHCEFNGKKQSFLFKTRFKKLTKK